MITLVFAMVCVVLALGATLAALLLGWTPRRRRRFKLRAIDRERDLAASLELEPRTWYLVRSVTLAALLGVGVASGVVYILVVAVVVGLFGVPWLVAGGAMRRRLRRDRAMVATLREVAQRISRTGVPLDQVLREVGEHPRPEVARLLSPLATATSVDEALAEAVVRSRSPMLSKAYLALAAGRSRQPRSLAAVLTEHLVPAFELDLELAERARSAAAQMRATVVVIGACLLVVFWVLNGQDVFHSYFTSAEGQLRLVASTAVFALSMVGMAALLRPPRQVRWDVMRARRELERLRRG